LNLSCSRGISRRCIFLSASFALCDAVAGRTSAMEILSPHKKDSDFMKTFRFELSDDFEGIFQVFYAPVPATTNVNSADTETFVVKKPDDCFLMKFPWPGKIRLDVFWKSNPVEEHSFSDIRRTTGLFKVERGWGGQGYSKMDLASVGIIWTESDWAQFEFPENAVLYFSRPDQPIPTITPAQSNPFLVPISFVREVVEYYNLIGRTQSEYLRK